MSSVVGTRINPLSRRPRQQRLVVAVRGAAGTGKSHFAASMADAGLGRLCYFDVERKARLLPGSDGSRFDAIEIQHPDELPEFIDWALDGEGREQGYGCYVLDSWAMYFGRKHRETLLAVRERTGDPTAQPSADELAADQMVLQEVLRRLCVDSGACVVIVDQIGAKGKEEREENELGRVLPLTTGGLEYFVDVMMEASVRLDDLRPVRVFRVVKSNSPAFPIGLELREFTGLVHVGAGPDRSGFLSAFFTLVGTHGAHVSVGLIWILVMTSQIMVKGLTAPVVSRLGRLGMFWHFLDIIWIGIFSVVYLPGVL